VADAVRVDSHSAVVSIGQRLRSAGHVGSLMDLIRRRCAKAIGAGSESSNKKLFDSVRIDRAAEKARGANSWWLSRRRIHHRVAVGVMAA
jgi:hypothetical protein